MRGLVRAALACAVLAFAPGWLDSFAPLKAALLAAAGAALAALLAARGGRPRDAVAWAALLALAAVAASAWTAHDRALAWSGELEQREGFSTWCALVALFLGARVAHGDAAARERTLDVVVGCAVIAAAYALAQFAGADFVVWGDAARYAHGGGETVRPGATLGNPILLGAVLAPALAIVTARLAAPPAARRGDALVLVAAGAVLAAALASTLSRGALLAAAAGAVAAPLLARAPWPRALGALAAVALPAAAWSAVALGSAPLARFAEGAAASSAPARLELARAALRLWREHPWLGVGPDGFGLAFPAVQSPAYWSRVWLGTPGHAHSAPLQLLVTLGALGVLALAVWGALAARPLWRALRADGARAGEGAALVALLVAAAFNPLGLAGAAVLVVLLALAAAPAPPAPAGARALPAPLAAALSATAASAVLVAFAPAARSLAHAGRARSALEQSVGARDDVRRALATMAAEAASAAIAARPRDDAPWRLAADAHLAAARAAADSTTARTHAEAALAAARGAQERRPARAANWLRLAQALAATGADAADVFAAAERRAPADALVLAEDARDALARGDAQRAAERARRIVAMYPEAALGYALEGAAELAAGRAPLARAAFRRAAAAHWEEGAEAQREAVRAVLARLAADSTGAR